MISIIILVVLFTTSLQAGVIPGRWEKLDSQPNATQIIVSLKSGDCMECGFRSSGPYDLTLIDQRGSERRVPKSEVQKIVSAEKIKDGLGNGAAVGAGVGLGVGLVMFLLVSSTCSGECPAGGEWLPILPMAAGVGAGVGLAADALHKGSEVLYQAP